ncbi:translocation and assembly module protein TamB [Aquicoccus porphyridii]|uniref:Translocation and assembly module protein TamB n=2 Tax=Aquicoccus porphyridii TaxID=1852029 RepID=A0A5A9Z7M5_9RHOB|nr:translocation/assembly module TamB domain-containing protein [Aquicoccus porphyridii]KAA0912975.1 translocation and assembly module protein TamB [Aquicoccus porphyridii]RAI54288.1 translocation and assembly module protein TamB [Rhodobacteraceae bacterium AsT-22]
MRFLAICLALLVPLGALAQDTESDRGFIQGLLEDALSAPGRSVRMEGFAGALSSRATIERIIVTDPEGTWLTATDLVLVWNRSALLRGRIAIDEITIGEIDLPRPPVPVKDPLPSPEASGGFALPDLPVSVEIAKMEITRAELGTEVLGQDAALSVSGKASLAGGAGEASLDVKRLDRPGQITLEGGFDNITRELRIDLALREPENGLAANLLSLPGRPSVQMEVQGDDPITDFTARMRLATDGQDRLTGDVTLTTDEDGATGFNAAVSGDLAPVLLPEFAAFLGDQVTLAASGERRADGGFLLDQLNIDTAAMQIGGTAEIGADGWPRELMLDAAISPPTGDRVTLPLPGPRTTVRAASLTAHFDAESGDEWRVDGTASGVEQDDLRIGSLEFGGSGRILRAAQSISGALRFEADGLIAPTNPALARALGERLRGGLEFGWSADAPLRLRNLALRGADYGLGGTITISIPDDLAALTVVPDLRLNADDLTRFAGLAGIDLGGRADLAISGRVEPLSGRMALRFDGQTQNLSTGLAPLDPLLDGQGRLILALERDETGLRADPVSIRTDHARIDAMANLASGNSTVSLTASLPQLARALPGLDGAAELTARAKQQGEVWTLSADSTLPGEAQVTYRGTISGDGVERLLADGALTAEIGRLAAFATLAKRPLAGSAQLTAKGNADLLAQSFDITASGQTSALDVGLPALAPLLRATTRFDLAAARDAQGHLTLDRLDLDAPDLDASLSGELGPEDGQFDYRLALTNLGLIIPELPGAARLSGSAHKAGARWQIDTEGQGPGGITLGVTGTVAEDGARADLGVTGTVPLALANARLSGQALSGLARLDLSLSGPLALESLSGRISVDDARLSLPAQAVALERMRGQVNLGGGVAQVALDADVSTGGQARLRGPITLSSPFQADLAVDLVDVTLRDPSLFEVVLDGALSLNGPVAGGARIGGRIDLRHTELRIPNLGPSYSPLDGLQHLRPPGAVQRTLRYAGMNQTGGDSGASTADFPLDILISAPNRLFVRGRGLDAELGGSLRLAGSTNDILPVGQFNLIRGRLDLLGQRLNLTEGSLTMRGSFDPVIGFAATSQVEEFSVSLRLDGLASAPDLTVTSVPELPQEEALSLFLFGRDVTRISAFQAVQLAAAIRTLSGQGGTGLTDGLRRSLGVDDLDIGMDDEGTTQARVGKYISENIYTDVTVKGDGTSQINLKLEVNRRTTVRGRLGSDGDTGIGVFFERDY